MAASLSPTTRRRYGVARVCRAWQVPRSSCYAVQSAPAAMPKPDPALRCGPKPAIADAALLDAIRADLARSPSTDEGHRKVWARLCTQDGIRVARKRILRLTREHHLLAPHRARPRPETCHERRITTDAPNVMWAIDATQATNVRNGKVWLFGVVEHWNTELLGSHVSRRGTRHEAIQALSMAVRQQFGHPSRDAARGLALRHDHGATFIADDFQRQMHFRGVSPSYAFVAEPETDGCIERMFRTLKERAIDGRIFQPIDDVRAVVRDFVARYNADWLIEKTAIAAPPTCAPPGSRRPSEAVSERRRNAGWVTAASVIPTDCQDRVGNLPDVDRDHPRRA